MRGVGVASAAVASCVLVAAAQDPSAPVQRPPFASGVTVVRVDASVTDRDGRAVTDLRESDVELLEDNAPQVLTSFRLINIPSALDQASGFVRPVITKEDEEREAARP